MYELKKSIRFEAAHHLPSHVDTQTGEPGKCSRPHGHSYEVAICVLMEHPTFEDNVRDPEESGITLDYDYLGRFLKEIHRQFDHRDLNTFDQFMGSPTAERIARWMADQWDEFKKDVLPDVGDLILLNYTEVKETESTYARYYP